MLCWLNLTSQQRMKTGQWKAIIAGSTKVHLDFQNDSGWYLKGVKNPRHLKKRSAEGPK